MKQTILSFPDSEIKTRIVFSGNAITTLTAHLYEMCDVDLDNLDEDQIDPIDFELYKRRPDMICKTIFVDFVAVSDLDNSAAAELAEFTDSIEQMYDRKFIVVLPVQMVAVTHITETIAVPLLKKEIVEFFYDEGFRNRNFLMNKDVMVSDYYDILLEKPEEDEPLRFED